MSANDREHSFDIFHDSTIQQRISSAQEVTYDLVQAELSSCKEKLDPVDLDLPVIMVVE